MMDPILQSVPMPIITPRLRIKAVHDQYTDAQIEAMRESKNEIGQWSAWINKPDALTHAARAAWLREGMAAFIKREKLYMVALHCETGQIIAGTGFHNIDWEIPSFEIGYWVRTSATRQGYATEITIALARYAFLALSARRVAIQHADGNVASERVITKAGFPREGIIRNDHLHVDGRVGDSYLYGVTHVDQIPAIDVTWGL